MIKATDLRLGNLLIYKGEVVYVTTLTLDVDDEREESIGFCKAGQATDEIIGWDRTLDLQGIAITPEWLERCGFEGGYGMGFDMGELYLWDHCNRQIATPLRELHRLQNLYHALTGTELEIKLP